MALAVAPWRLGWPAGGPGCGTPDQKIEIKKHMLSTVIDERDTQETSFITVLAVEWVLCMSLASG